MLIPAPTSPPDRTRPTCRQLLAAMLTLIATAAASALDAPSVPEPIPDVPRVMQFLESIRGELMLSGQQEQVDWFGKNNEPEFDWIFQQTGKHPAVRSFDFIFLSISNAEGRRGQRIAERAIEWRRRGGLVHVTFHWNAGAPNESFYVNQNGSRSDFDLERALTPGHRDHDEFVTEMDAVAEELKRLRDAGVAVIWRPFHEVNGNAGPNGGPGAWFWWGNKGPEVFKRGWKFMFERFTHHHGLNNLIWCYNPTAVAGALEAWYPGDEYVDMVSFDAYPAVGTHSTFADVYQRFVQFKGGKKVIAMSENGGIPDPDLMFSDGPNAAGWSFFSTWDRQFIMNSPNNPLEFLQRVYHHPNVVTLDELLELLPTPPAIVVQAMAASAPRGARVAMSVMAEGPGPLAYQWYKDSAPIAGATSTEYVIGSVSPAHAGTYNVRITNSPGGETWGQPATFAVEAQDYVPPAAQVVNLSTRGWVGNDADMMIAGFVIEGSGAKKLLIRAVGPTLADFDVNGTLQDAALRLYNGANQPLLYRDDWSEDPEAAAVRTGPGFALPEGSLDAATVVSLPPGNYSVTVRSPMSGTGNALIEVYDLDPTSAARLKNVSTRGRIPNEHNPMIAGFVLSGASQQALVVRGIGPGLGTFGVPGVISDLYMTLHDESSAELLRNEDWDPALADAFARVGAFGLESGSEDTALRPRLAPGAYSAIVHAPAGASGVALVEVYADPTGPQ